MTAAFEGKHAEIAEKTIKAFYNVYNQLGYGFSEKVYKNAMIAEGEALALTIDYEKQILVYYNNIVVGEYIADLLINGFVIIELKSVHKLLPEHEAQLLNYLKATPIEVGLLLNFGPKPELQRKVYDNSRKGNLSWTNWPHNPI